ncbi:MULTISPECIES: SDR family NAD(P)-dependent oxidoreductase [Citromicrobium]|uniref:SDR family NAD(P)-dependent oxidoreductase n=1 Tax=Citromicrobium TaxID=72173 RepID=UPI0001DD057E|nr:MULTISPECIES: SDR family oxidoreductase [Citromicrobium]ALG60474.1 short-chain dehydrogenase [Citromicrobium sp. JL477]
MPKLAQRVAIVTGASAGLGRSFAQVLAREGAKTVLVARRAEALEMLVGEIEGEGGQAIAVQVDLTNADAAEHILDAATQAFGTPDILINNAGMADAGFATKLSLDTIDKVIDLDFRAPFLLSRGMADRLIAREMAGWIVNISSVGARYYAPKSASALYCSCKAGLIRMTETLAIEWAEYGINVNAIAPGTFESEMTAEYIERKGDRVQQNFPRKRFGQPAELASTLLYLVDPASRFVTGTCITVDDAQTPR